MFGGCGLGLGYVSPVSTLIRWFPDRRGMAAGMAIMGFGGGDRILINDRKMGSDRDTASAINVTRNGGVLDIEI
mgnify:CR=1 FL=1